MSEVKLTSISTEKLIHFGASLHQFPGACKSLIWHFYFIVNCLASIFDGWAQLDTIAEVEP